MVKGTAVKLIELPSGHWVKPSDVVAVRNAGNGNYAYTGDSWVVLSNGKEIYSDVSATQTVELLFSSEQND